MRAHSDLHLPREHGAWGFLYVPLLLGALVGGGLSFPVLLLALSATCLFIAREPLLAWWRARRWGKDTRRAACGALLYLALAGLFAAPLAAWFELWGLAPLAAAGVILLAINLRSAVNRQEKTIGGEVLAIAGLTLTAPAAYYTAAGRWEPVAAALWLLSIVYFTSSVLYIKLRLLARTRRIPDRDRVARQSAIYHAAVAAVLIVLAITGTVNWFLFLAFVPVLLRTFWHMARAPRELALKKIGWLEVGYSLAFLSLLAVSFRAA